MDRGRLKVLFDNADDDDLTFQQKPVDQAKVNAFSGAAARSKSKKEREAELLEEKKRAEEQEASRVFEEYVTDFAGESRSKGPGFVRASGSGTGASADRTYAPRAPKALAPEQRLASASPPPPMRPKGTRAMDSFLDEIKREQADRENRYGGRSKYKGTSVTALAAYDTQTGGRDRGDSETTNLFVAHLPENLNEMMFGNHFGQYGEITSIKIMWPRGDEPGAEGPGRRSKSGGLSGFVSFKRRKDAEHALKKLDGADWGGSVLRVGWSKSVPTSGRVIYGRQPSSSRSRSPPPHRKRGHDFSRSRSRDRRSPSRSRSRSRDRGHTGRGSRRSLSRDRERRHGQSHRHSSREPRQKLTRDEEDFIGLVANSVRKSGRDYEEALSIRERNNPLYSFLLQQRSEGSRYYDDFLDPENDAPYGFEDDGYNSVYSTDYDERKEAEKGVRTKLGYSAVKRFKAMLRAMTGKRGEVARCMAFALEHGEAATEVTNIIISSILVDETSVPRKMARLGLISDILHNSAVPLPHAWKYRQEFMIRLGLVFDHLSNVYHSFPGRITADTFKRQIIALIDVWDDWIVFPPEQTGEWRDRLDGKPVSKQEEAPLVVQVPQQNATQSVNRFKSSAFKPVEEAAPAATAGSDEDMDMQVSDSDTAKKPCVAEEVDGEPLEDLDGEPMEDIDGAPLDDGDIDGEPLDLDGEPLEDVDGDPL